MNKLVKGAVAGAIGGISGALAMSALQYLYNGRGANREQRELAQRGGRHDISQLKERARITGRRQQDATVKTARTITKAFVGTPLPHRYDHAAGLAVHYSFAVGTGAAYGVLVEFIGRSRLMNGVIFGLTLWGIAEEIALPAAGLTGPASEYRRRDHIEGLLAHEIFGVTTECIRRLTAEALQDFGSRRGARTSVAAGQL